MIFTKLKPVVLGLLVAAGVSSTGLPVRSGVSFGIPAALDEKKGPAGPGRLLLARENDLLTLTPEKEVEGRAPKGAPSTLDGQLSPDAFVADPRTTLTSCGHSR